MKINSGIYKFQNKINGKVYIGQTKYLNTRYRQHKSELLHGTHHNEYFQREVTKYGFDNFDYSIIKKCSVNELDYSEEYYFKVFDSQNRQHGYNIKNPGNESDMPKQTKQKIRYANRGRNSKLTPEEVESIKLSRLKGLRCKDLADIYGVTISTINKITMCKNWEYIRSDLNDRLKTQAQREEKKTEIKIKELYQKGLRPNQIKKELKISLSVVSRVLAYELQKEKDTEKQVVFDFMNMKSIDEIMQTRNITYAQYKRITKGLKTKRDQIIYGKIVEYKKQGIFVKDIANLLNINRSTVNEICKRFSVQVNTEVTL